MNKAGKSKWPLGKWWEQALSARAGGREAQQVQIPHPIFLWTQEVLLLALLQPEGLSYLSLILGPF